MQVQQATVRFAGDSGDGMQLVGSQFADLSSIVGNVICTMPDYPSEIRAPAGSLAGVSGYQLNFGGQEVTTPGDAPFVLIAMNPAALKVNLAELQPGGVIVANEDEFTPDNLEKARYDSNPLEDGSLQGINVIRVPMTRLNEDAVKHTGLSRAQRARCRNFFALGIALWLYDRPIQPALEWLMKKFQKTPDVMAANGASLRAGMNYANTAELFRVHYQVLQADLPKGRYRRVTGNEAIALGLVAGALSGRSSAGLRQLSDHAGQRDLARTLAAQGVRCSDGSGGGRNRRLLCGRGCRRLPARSARPAPAARDLSLKTEALGLAVMTELPLVAIDVQRSGPSTGMPTKTEQGDLLMANFGRHGESPLVVLAMATPADGFYMAFEAVRLATKYMTPVLLLSDSYLANCAEPMLIPDADALPDIAVRSHVAPADFAPYRRDAQTLARPWVVPGTPGLEHRIGGLEKEDVTGIVSYDAANHQRMVQPARQQDRGDRRGHSAGGSRGRRTGRSVDRRLGEHVRRDCGRRRGTAACRAAGEPSAPAVPESLSPQPRRTAQPLPHHSGPGEQPGTTHGAVACQVSRYMPESFTKVDGRPFLIREIQAKVEEILSRD